MDNTVLIAIIGGLLGGSAVAALIPLWKIRRNI